MAKTETVLGTMVWSDRNPWVEQMDPTPRMQEFPVSLLTYAGDNEAYFTSTLNDLVKQYGGDATIDLQIEDHGQYEQNVVVDLNIRFERMETPEEAQARADSATKEALTWERRSAAAQVRAEKQRAKRQAEQDTKYRQYLELKKIFEKMERENPPTT